MRTLLVVSAMALFFSACTEADNFQAPVDSLSTEWEGTTSMVSEFVNTLQSSQQELQNQFAQMTVPEGLTLNEASADQVAGLKADYQEELGSLSDLSQSVSSFISDWQGKAEKLNELKEGLTGGNLGAGTMETVENLKSSVGEATSGMERWKGELADIKANTGDLAEQFSALMANLQGN